MADRPVSIAEQEARLAAHAAGIVTLADRRLHILAKEGGSFEDAVRFVDEAVLALDRLSRRADCTDLANGRLVDWRDCLGSYLHAARALADVRIDSGVANHLLQRGLDDVASAIKVVRWERVLTRR
jgi:hypothetical protein